MKKIIFLALIGFSIASCCKEVDGTCCKDETYFRIDNRSEYILTSFQYFDQSIPDINIQSNQMSGFYSVSGVKNDTIGSHVYLNLINPEDSSDFWAVNGGFDSPPELDPEHLPFISDEGCYTLRIDSISESVFSDNLYGEIIEE